MANDAKLGLSHVVLFCSDLDRMAAFYKDVLGFIETDRGQARGGTIAFLTLDPEIDHHMIALATGRSGEGGESALNHIAFRVAGMPELRAKVAAVEAADGVSAVEHIDHGAWWSLYFRDPEGNRVEFFVDAPYYVQQPVVEALDLSKSDDEILHETLETYGDTPGFRPIGEWKTEAGARHRANKDRSRSTGK